jgi:hypothetical protein
MPFHFYKKSILNQFIVPRLYLVDAVKPFYHCSDNNQIRTKSQLQFYERITLEKVEFQHTQHYIELLKIERRG